MLIDYFFWFTQPTTAFRQYDWWFGYLYAGLLGSGLALYVIRRFVTHPITKKLMGKIMAMSLTMGFSGLVWLGLRYENIPIFAKRFWAGLLLLGLLIWIGYVVKYLVFNFRSEHKIYDAESIKRKYLPSRH